MLSRPGPSSGSSFKRLAKYNRKNEPETFDIDHSLYVELTQKEPP